MNSLSHLIPQLNQLVCKGTVTISIDKETPLEIPISSQGVLELRNELMHYQPIPPKKSLVIKANSDVGRELGLKEDTLKLVPDEADARYIQQKNQYNIDFLWAIVIQGIDMDFYDSKKKMVTDPEEQKAIMLLNGFTISHLETILASILKLGEVQVEDMEAYIKRSVGFTSSIESKVKSRNRKSKSGDTGPVFNQIEIMRDYNLTPDDWADTSDSDRLTMVYSTLLRFHREAEQIDSQKREMELEKNKQRVMGSMPTFSGGGR